MCAPGVMAHDSPAGLACVQLPQGPTSRRHKVQWFSAHRLASIVPCGADTSRWTAALLVVSHTASLCAQPSNEEMNASNNPLTPSLGLNLQDQYTDSFYGLDDADSNAALLRASLPHKLFGIDRKST